MECERLWGTLRLDSSNREFPQAACAGRKPVELYALAPPAGEPEVVHAASPPDAGDFGTRLRCRSHDASARGTRARCCRRGPVARDACECSRSHDRLADIETPILGRSFPVVLLASQLVNTPNRRRRSAFLMTCRRHVRSDGVIVIQRASPTLATWPGVHADVVIEAQGSVDGSTTQGCKTASFLARCTTSLGTESGSSSLRHGFAMMTTSKLSSSLSGCTLTDGLMSNGSGLRQSPSEGVWPVP